MKNVMCGVLSAVALVLAVPGMLALADDALPPLLRQGYTVLDTWLERKAIGATDQARRAYKVTSQATGRDEVLYFTEAGEPLVAGQMQLMANGEELDRIDPRLRVQFGRRNGMMALGEGEAERVDVIIWLRVPAAVQAELDQIAAEDTTPQTQHEEEGGLSEGADEAAIAARDARLAAENAALLARRARVAEKFAGVVENFVAEENIAEDQIVYKHRYAPGIVLRLTLAEAERLSGSPLVNYLFPNDEAKKELDVVGPASKVPTVWAQGYTGAGVKIAILEAGGRVNKNNPYLAGTVLRDSDEAVDGHAAAVGGIIRSLHSSYKGIAYGCQLLSSTTKSGNNADVDEVTDWAVAQGAVIINGSYGYSNTTNNSSLH